MNSIRNWLLRVWVWLTARTVALEIDAQEAVYHDVLPNPLTEPSMLMDDQFDTPKPERKEKTKRAAGLRELLASLDETFSLYRLPFAKVSWLGKSEATGLRKLGVHVVNASDEVGIWKANAQVIAPGILPAMICISFGLSKFDTPDAECDATGEDGSIHPAFFFSIKQNQLPPTVSPFPGQHFLFGMAFRMGSKYAHDRAKDLFWVAGYLTVSSDGSLHVHRELKSRSIPIPSRRFRSEHLTRMAWGTASLASLASNKGQRDGCDNIKNYFVNSMEWWMARDQSWSVSVNKGGERVTFSVPKEETKHFFKDRIKVKTPSGATKKIVHYVRSHEREVEGGKTVDVREHIRGLFSFAWNGYQCNVTAPNFNGFLNTSFVAPALVEGIDDMTGKEMIEISKLGSLLADSEEPRKRA